MSLCIELFLVARLSSAGFAAGLSLYEWLLILTHFRIPLSVFCPRVAKPELELIQPHMTQKPLLWVEVGAHAVRKRSECAGVVWAGAGVAW
jgi:hypothetical protein